MEIINSLLDYLTYPFVRHAIVVGLLVALCSSLMGVPLVLKRMSVIGDGLSHVSFGAMALASILKLTGAFSTAMILVITIIAAIFILQGTRKRLVRGDAAIAMLASSALALGYLLLNLFKASSNLSGDVCTTLFGSTSILTISTAEVWLCVILSTIVLLLFILFYNKIFAVTFDPTFAEATGVRVDAYDMGIAIVAATVIVLSMTLVGALLVSALIVFPALSAMRVFRSFRTVSCCAAAISIVCALTGILTSILCDTPVGATIVVMNLIVFIGFSIVGRCRA